MRRLFCATVFVFDEAGQKTLFIDHHKLGKWVPPGGKIDPDEIPDNAALRETFEETGLRVALIGEVPSVKGGCVRPYGVQVNTVTPGELEHIDLIYLAVPVGNSSPQVNEREASEARWFSVSDVLMSTFNTFDTVQDWVKRFSKEFPLR